MNETNCKEVRFDKYCKICKHADLEGHKDPCNECLDNPALEGTEKPINYQETNK